MRMRNVIVGHTESGPVFTPTLVSDKTGTPDYDLLHRRCMNQRRELKRLNRKIQNLELHLIKASRDGLTWLHQQRWAFEIHHRNNELKRKLDDALAQLDKRDGAAE